MSDDTFDLSEPYGDSDLTNLEVFCFGAAVLNAAAASMRLGHTSPGMTLDYMTNPEALGLFGLVARDFIAWTSGRKHMVPDCEQRFRQWASSVAGALPYEAAS